MPVLPIAKFYAIGKFQAQYLFSKQSPAQVSINGCIIISCMPESFNRKVSTSFVGDYST